MSQFEIVGYIAGFLVSISLTPQLIKTWMTKSTKDISILWTIILMTGLLFWIIYASFNQILPLLIFGIIEFSMASTLLIFKNIYK